MRRFIPLIALLAACTRSGFTPTAEVDCGDAVRVVVANATFCVYRDGVAPEACPEALPHLVNHTGVPLCGGEAHPDASLLEAAVVQAFEADAGVDGAAAKPDAGVVIQPGRR